MSDLNAGIGRKTGYSSGSSLCYTGGDPHGGLTPLPISPQVPRDEAPLSVPMPSVTTTSVGLSRYRSEYDAVGNGDELVPYVSCPSSSTFLPTYDQQSQVSQEGNSLSEFVQSSPCLSNSRHPNISRSQTIPVSHVNNLSFVSRQSTNRAKSRNSRQHALPPTDPDKAMIEFLNIQLNLSKATVVEQGEVITEYERRTALLEDRIRRLSDQVNRLQLPDNLTFPNVTNNQSSQTRNAQRSQSSSLSDDSRSIDIQSRILSTLTSLKDTVVSMSTLLTSHCSKNA